MKEIIMKMKEPISTLTNLVFVVAGIPMLLTGTLAGVYTFLCMVLLCVGSWRYHQTLTSRNSGFDEVAMYWAFFALIAVEMSAYIEYQTAMALAIAASIIFTVNWRTLAVTTFVPILVFIAIILNGIAAGLVSSLYIFGILMVASIFKFTGPMILQRMNNTKVAIIIDDIFHSVWHILAAYGMYLLWYH